MEEKRINAYMQSHPEVKVFYFTTDGLAFTSEGQAEQHQMGLTNSSSDVEVVERAPQLPDEDEAFVQLMEKIEKERAKMLDLEGDELAQQQEVVDALELELDKLG